MPKSVDRCCVAVELVNKFLAWKRFRFLYSSKVSINHGKRVICVCHSLPDTCGRKSRVYSAVKHLRLSSFVRGSCFLSDCLWPRNLSAHVRAVLNNKQLVSNNIFSNFAPYGPIFKLFEILPWHVNFYFGSYVIKGFAPVFDHTLLSHCLAQCSNMCPTIGAW